MNAGSAELGRRSILLAYFAYGSNMLLARLRERVPSADPIGTAILTEHRLLFHKRSRDGSGKGNILETGDPKDEVHGVVYEILDTEKPSLDRAEGLGVGYFEKVVRLRVGQTWCEAFTYFANDEFIDDVLKPYAWYKDFVLFGAKENNLSSEYISAIEAVEAIEDRDSEREGMNRRILKGKA